MAGQLNSFVQKIYSLWNTGNDFCLNLECHAETSDMTSEGLGELFEGDSADTCGVKFPLVSMGGRAKGLACADPGARFHFTRILTVLMNFL
jgi:hypothetical protein